LTYYPHPLDYVTGLKHVLTHRKIRAELEITPDTFSVEEIVNLHGLGFDKDKGDYAVFRVVKKSIDSLRVKRRLAKQLGIPESNVLHLGLKDKESTSTQHFFVKKTLISRELRELHGENFTAILIGFTRVKPTRKSLVGNRFKVRLETASTNDYHTAEDLLRLVATSGLPSYYGYQRFGVERPISHLLGKQIILKREDRFSTLFLRDHYPWENPNSVTARVKGFIPRKLFYEKLYVESPLSKGLELVDKLTSKILVEAYASYLYNLLLNKLIDTYGWECLNRELPTPGCKSGELPLYMEIFETEGLNPESAVQLGCWWRAGLFKPFDISLRLVNNILEISFSLGQGFYASVVLRELFKENLVLK